MMTPFKVRVFEALVTHYNKKFTYIRTVHIASGLGAGYKRTIRTLRELEDAGLAQRKGERGGWRPAIMAGAIYRTVLIGYRQKREHVSTTDIATKYEKDSGWIRQYLRRLEAGELIERATERSGWKPVRTSHTPACDKILAVLEELWWKTRTFISTIQIAKTLNLNPRYARDVLRRYEEQGLVSRKGQRGGWRPQFARAI